MFTPSDVLWPVMQAMPLPANPRELPTYDLPPGVEIFDVDGRYFPEAWDAYFIWDLALVRHVVSVPMLGVPDDAWRSSIARNDAQELDLALFMAVPWPHDEQTAYLCWAFSGRNIFVDPDPALHQTAIATFFHLARRLASQGYTRLLTIFGHDAIRQRFVENVPLFTDTHEYVPGA